MLLNFASEAEAQTLVRLDYQPAGDSSGCPDEVALRDAVAARLGYQPFDDEAQRTVVVHMSKSGQTWTGRVELRDGNGELLGERSLDSSAEECRELGPALELIIAIAIDPLAMSRPTPEPEESPDSPAPPPPEPPAPPPPVVEPETEAEPEPPEDEEQPRTLRFRARLEVHGTVGTAQSIAFGVTVQVGLRWRALSVALEGRGDIPRTGETLGGELETSLLLLGLVPCGHWRMLAICGVAYGGAIRARSIGFDNPERTTTQYWALGGRVGLEFSILGPLMLNVRVDLLAAPVRTTYTASDRVAWTSPPVSFAFGGGLTGSF